MPIASLHHGLKKIQDTFDPFLQFWVYARNWKNWRKAWMSDAFNSLDAEGMEKDVGNAFKAGSRGSLPSLTPGLRHFLSSTEAPLCVPVPVTIQAIPLCGAQVKELNSG